MWNWKIILDVHMDWQGMTRSVSIRQRQWWKISSSSSHRLFVYIFYQYVCLVNCAHFSGKHLFSVPTLASSWNTKNGSNQQYFKKQRKKYEKKRSQTFIARKKNKKIACVDLSLPNLAICRQRLHTEKHTHSQNSPLLYIYIHPTCQWQK